MVIMEEEEEVIDVSFEQERPLVRVCVCVCVRTSHNETFLHTYRHTPDLFKILVTFTGPVRRGEDSSFT